MTPLLSRHAGTLLVSCLIGLGGDIASAAPYQVGDTVTNLTFTVRREFTRPDGAIVPAGSQARIQDFAGHVVFLEWFAVWCPFCIAAVPQIDAGIRGWYESRSGNPYGVPVLHLFVNQESGVGFQNRTSTYIKDKLSSSTIVFNDYGIPGSNPVRAAFQSSGQPIFAVINGITNSPTHQPWQVLVNHRGYGETDFGQEILNFRAAIDAVQPPVVAPLLTNAHREGADFEFNIQSQIGSSYQVLSSTNMTSWTALRTNIGASSLTTFRDTNAPPDLNFYRVVTP